MKSGTKAVVFVGVLAAGYAAVAIAAWRIMPGKIAEAEQKRVGVTMALSKIANDQLTVSRRISDITAQTLGKGRDKASQVSELLGDPALNRMALTYTGADWATMRSSFVGNVKHMRDLLKMQKGDRKKQISRMNEKIKELERKRRILLETTVPTANRNSGGSNIPHEQWRRKVDDIDRQLSMFRSSTAYREYLENDKSADNEIEVKKKTEAAIFKVASECEAQTVGKLVQTMAEKATALRYEEAEPDRLRQQMTYFDVWPFNMLFKMPSGERDGK